MASPMKRAGVSLVLAAACATLSACGSSDDVALDDGGGLGDGSGLADGDLDGGLKIDGGDPDAIVVGDGLVGDSACAATSQKVELAPLDILLALDNSYSMDFDGKWPAVKSAIEAFIKDAKFAGLGFGINFYPARKSCASSEYEVPELPIQILPLGATDIVTQLEARRMSGGTPLVPVMQGSGVYTKDWATKNPTHKVVILLASDGVPDDTCSAPGTDGLTNTLDNTVAVTKKLKDGAPSVSTFVIGVGSSLTQLDQIASAGGTGTAILVDVGGDIGKSFLDALDAIRKTAITCDYAIPPPTSGKIDYDKVNVRFSQGDGTAIDFTYVGKKEDCGLAPHGWYYDDPITPTKVILCDGPCDEVKSSSDGRVDVLFGCKRNDVK